VEEGTRIRLTGEGEAGVRGGPNGDLYVFISVQPHPLFHREGSQLHCEVPIKMSTAALGGSIEVPTIDGIKAKVNIPAGTQSGTKFRLKGKGMSVLRSKSRGDMIIHANVEIPQNLTRKQKELLEAFDAEGDANSHPQSSGFFERIKDFFSDLKE
jgi:molecular chaperone DnaJ